jgi:hypothetical protein
MKIKLSDTIILLVLLIFINLSAFSQKAPMKYGKINKADLEMKVYPLDTSASAAVLCDYGYFDSNQFQFVRTLRVKIFKKEGLDWANKTFPGDSKGNVRGITFNLENGQIIESKLKSESIFKERVTEDYYRLRIAMPNVKEGSIMDMEFVYPTLPSEWRFQQEIPVRWSELVVETSPYVEFRKNFTGFERLAETSDMRWVAKDVPAFKKEPYMNDVSNYITKFEIELLRVSLPGNEHSAGYYREYSTDWNHVVGRLMSNSYFGGTLTGCGFLNDIVKEIESKYTDPLDKLKAGQAAIKKAVKWNKEEALFTTVDGLSQPFKKKIGNSADINLMLIQLLRKLKLNIDLVVLSTRSNGMLSYSPSMDKLNYVVGYATIGDKKYFVDATNDNIPVGILPERCLNLRGRIIYDKTQEEISLKPEKKHRQVIQTDLKLEPDLILTGKINIANHDYAALDAREAYEEFNSQEEYLKDVENDHQGLSIIKCEIKNKDSIYLPFMEEYEVKIKNKVTNVGNLLYVNPLLYEQMESNPFKVEERKYPVDFIYPMEKLYVFKLTLPENMQVSEVPKPLIIKLPDNSATIQYQVTTLGKVVQLVYKFNITKPNYTNEDYTNLRAFFSELVKKHAEPIIIKTL